MYFRACTIGLCAGVSHPGDISTPEHLAGSSVTLSWDPVVPDNFSGTVEYELMLYENGASPDDLGGAPIISGVTESTSRQFNLGLSLNFDVIHTVVWSAYDKDNDTTVFADDCYDFVVGYPAAGTSAPGLCGAEPDCGPGGECKYTGNASPATECDCNVSGWSEGGDGFCDPSCNCVNNNFFCTEPDDCDTCIAGFSGADCDEPGCDPEPNSCVHGGTCVQNGAGDYVCITCDVGWGGPFCVDPECDVVLSDCNGNGECACPSVGCQAADQPVCECTPPYTGEKCENGEDVFPDGAVSLNLAPGSFQYFSVPVESTSNIQILLTVSTGDGNLYFREEGWPTLTDFTAQSAKPGTAQDALTIEKISENGQLLVHAASLVGNTTGTLEISFEGAGLNPLVIIGVSLGAAAVVGVGTIAFVRSRGGGGRGAPSASKKSGASSEDILSKYKSADNGYKSDPAGASGAAAAAPSPDGSAHTAAGAVNRRAAAKKPGVKFGQNQTQEAPKRKKSVNKGAAAKSGGKPGLLKKEGAKAGGSANKGPGHKRTNSDGRKPSSEGRGSRGGRSRSKSPNKAKRLSGGAGKPMGGPAAGGAGKVGFKGSKSPKKQ